MELQSRAMLLLFFLALARANVEEEAIRVSCLPDRVKAEDEEICHSRGCVWSPPSEDDKAPACFYPQDYGYTELSTENTDNGFRVNLQRKGSRY